MKAEPVHSIPLFGEQIRPQDAQQLLAGVRDVIGRLPLAHGRLADLAKTGDGSGAAELFDDVGCVHVPILGELKLERNKHPKDISEYAGSMLKDRLRRAMDGPPRVSQVALAKACGVTGPAVNDWLSGKTKTMRGEYLMAAARFLGVSADWLASGKGAARHETNSEAQSTIPSQSPQLDRAILHDALMLLMFDETHGGEYVPRERSAKLAELYEWIAACGGELSKEQNAAFIQQVNERHKEAGGSSVSVDKSRRKARQGTSRN